MRLQRSSRETRLWQWWSFEAMKCSSPLSASESDELKSLEEMIATGMKSFLEIGRR